MPVTPNNVVVTAHPEPLIKDAIPELRAEHITYNLRPVRVPRLKSVSFDKWGEQSLRGKAKKAPKRSVGRGRKRVQILHDTPGP